MFDPPPRPIEHFQNQLKMEKLVTPVLHNDSIIYCLTFPKRFNMRSVFSGKGQTRVASKTITSNSGLTCFDHFRRSCPTWYTFSEKNKYNWLLIKTEIMSKKTHDIFYSQADNIKPDRFHLQYSLPGVSKVVWHRMDYTQNYQNLWTIALVITRFCIQCCILFNLLDVFKLLTYSNI